MPYRGGLHEDVRAAPLVCGTGAADRGVEPAMIKCVSGHNAVFDPHEMPLGPVPVNFEVIIVPVKRDGRIHEEVMRNVPCYGIGDPEVAPDVRSWPKRQNRLRSAVGVETVRRHYVEAVWIRFGVAKRGGRTTKNRTACAVGIPCRGVENHALL